MKCILSILSFTLFASICPAASVINWVTTNGDATFGGTESTSSPIATDADADTIVGSFPAVALTTNQGIILTGRFNIAGSGGIPANQIRWGLFDAPGTPTTGDGSGYVGVWAAAPAAGSADLVTANGSTTNPFSGTASSAVVSASDFGGNPVVYGTDYDFSLTITRLDATQIEISASLTDNADVSINWPATATNASPGSFTYDAVGILLGGTTDAPSATFTNIEVNTIPEPSGALLGGLGLLILLRRRRA